MLFLSIDYFGSGVCSECGATDTTLLYNNETAGCIECNECRCRTYRSGEHVSGKAVAEFTDAVAADRDSRD